MPTLMPTSSPFGALIRDVRLAREMTGDDVAEECGVQQGTVSRWEAGVQLPNPRQMAALNRVLGISWDDYGAEVARRLDANGPGEGTVRELKTASDQRIPVPTSAAASLEHLPCAA